MRSLYRILGVLFFVLPLLALSPGISAQTGNSSTVQGTVTDPSGGVVSNAVVTMHNPVSGFERSATTDASGAFNFSNVPFNPYHLSISAAGFAPYAQDVDVRSSVPVELKIALAIGGKFIDGDGGRRIGPAGERFELSTPTWTARYSKNFRWRVLRLR